MKRRELMKRREFVKLSVPMLAFLGAVPAVRIANEKTPTPTPAIQRVPGKTWSTTKIDFAPNGKAFVARYTYPVDARGRTIWAKAQAEYLTLDGQWHRDDAGVLTANLLHTPQWGTGMPAEAEQMLRAIGKFQDGRLVRWTGNSTNTRHRAR